MYYHITSLRVDSGYSQEERNSIMWNLIGDDGNDISEGEYANEFECSLCKKNMSSQYNVVEHVQGRIHQSELEKSRYITSVLQAIANIEGQGFGKNFAIIDDAIGDIRFRCRICKNCEYYFDTTADVESHTYTRQHRKALAKLRELFPLKTDSDISQQRKVQVMWQLVRKAEGECFDEDNFEPTGAYSYYCCICDVHMSSPYNVVQHARGRKHQTQL